MAGIFISDIGVYLPETEISNEFLVQKFGGNTEDIFKKTGVKRRFHTTLNFLMSQMAQAAAEKIFEQKPELKKTIDAIILVGHGFEYKAPITAALVQERLGLRKECLTIDTPHGCSGYVNALGIA